jgi:hypothetical protein
MKILHYILIYFFTLLICFLGGYIGTSMALKSFLLSFDNILLAFIISIFLSVIFYILILYILIKSKHLFLWIFIFELIAFIFSMRLLLGIVIGIASV